MLLLDQYRFQKARSDNKMASVLIGSLFLMTLFDFSPSSVEASVDSILTIPQFAVEPSNVRIVDSVGSARSAVFTCLLSQPTQQSDGDSNQQPLIAGSGALISWFYNAKQVDSITDKIRIPLANGSLYVSAAVAEHPTPNSPLSDVPLPTGKGYYCRAAGVVNYNKKSYNVTIVSRVAHIIKQQNLPSTSGNNGQIRPQRLSVRMGDVVVLACGGGSAASSLNANTSASLVLGGDGGEQFVWFRDDMPFPDENAASRWGANSAHPTVTLIDNGRVVEFSSISSDDFGEYACSKASIAAEQRRNSLISRFVISQTTAQNLFENMEPKVRFLMRPNEKLTVSRLSSSAPSSVTLFCSAAGIGGNTAGAILTTSWLKDGETITTISPGDASLTTSSSDESAQRYRKIGRSSLLISNLSSNDSALYTCRASITVSETTIFADANVAVSVVTAPKHLPEESFRSKIIVSSTSGSVEISCGIENAETFFWFHNGNYLEPTNNTPDEKHLANSRANFYEYGLLTNNSGRSLSLWALTDSDSGIYQCFGVNAAGLVSSTTLLVVEQIDEKLAVFASPAATKLRSDAEEDRAKRPLDVRATSRSATTIRLAWEAPVLSAGAIISGYVVLLKSATLLSKNEAPIDAASRIRRMFAAHPELLIDRLAPGRKYEITVAAAFKTSSQTTLTVGAMSQPLVINTEKLLPDTAETTTAMTLVENNRDGADDFLSQNSQQPKNLKAELRSPTTVSLAWAAPNSDSQTRQSASIRSVPGIFRYRLFYRSGTNTPGIRNSQQDSFIDLPGHQTTHVFTSLQPNTPYTFFVRAGVSGNGGENGEAAQLIFGPASRDVTIWTPSAAPTGSPQKVEAVATSPSSISVRWQPPLTNLQNGLITGYKIVYQPRSRLSVTQAPSLSHQFTGRTSITDGITTMISLKDGIAPSTEYEIRVSAININGSGPFSESVFAKTPEQQLTESATPGAPFAFTARAHSPSQIVLTWQPPSSASSILVRGYYISFGVGEPYRNQVMVDSTKTEHILTNLRPNSEYIISLRSYNNYGYGPEVFQAVRTPQLSTSNARASSEVLDEPPPGFDLIVPNNQNRQQPAVTPLAVPLGVKAFTLSDSAILVSWTDPNEHSYRSKNQHHPRGGANANNNNNKEHHVTYTVRYGPLVSQMPSQDNMKNAQQNLPPVIPSPMRWRTVNSTLPSVRVHSLEPFQEYEFSVRIVRVDADYPSRQQISDWSMSATNRTLDAQPGDAPRDVKVTEVPPSVQSRGVAVRISWQPPLKPNGIIASYVVFYSAHSPNRAERDWQVIGVGGDRFSVLIRRLQPDTSYYFKVQAKNGRGYGPPSMPPVHIRTSVVLQPHKPVVLSADEEAINAIGESRPGSNRLGPPQQHQQPESSQVDLVDGDDMWPFDPTFFENHVMQRGGLGVSSTAVPLFVTTAIIRNVDGNSQEYLENGNNNHNSAITNAGASTLWLAVSAAVGALIVCIIASVAVFICRKISSPRSSTAKLMSKSESMGNGRMTANGNGKLAPSDGNGLPSASNADMWAMRDHLELRQQLLSSAELQSTVGVSGGGMSVLTMSEDNLMPNERATSSARHRPSQSAQDQQGTASIRQHLYHLDPYENETMIIGEGGQTTTSIACSPTTAYRHQQAAAANARLFTSRTSTATLSCQESAYPLLSNSHHAYRHQNGGGTSASNDADEFIVDVNPGSISTARLNSVLPYHMQHRGSPASIVNGGLTINDHGHLIHQGRGPMLVNHQTLPRLSIATMPSPGPASMHHRYEPLLTTTSSGAFCPPPAQTPDSGCDIDHNLHHQIQQQQRQQRTSLSSSSYGGGSVSSSTTNNIAPFGCSSSSCASRQQQILSVSGNPNGEATNSPTSGLSASVSNNNNNNNNSNNNSDRPRLSSFQPIQTSNNNGTPTGLGPGVNKTSFLHLSRVLPPTPGQARSSTSGSSSATMSSSACNSSQQPDRTSSATLSSNSPINNNGAIQDTGTGLTIHLPPAPPELHSTTGNDDDLAAAAEMSCLDGLIKDLKLNVATCSSVTLTGGGNNNLGASNGICGSSSTTITSSRGSSSTSNHNGILTKISLPTFSAQ